MSAKCTNRPGRQIPIEFNPSKSINSAISPPKSAESNRNRMVKSRDSDTTNHVENNGKPPGSANEEKAKMERPHCNTCFEDFDDEEHRPCIGQCGHSLCLECQKRIIHCPFCNQRFAFYSTVVNYQLLDTISDLEKFHIFPKLPKMKRSPQSTPKIEKDGRQHNIFTDNRAQNMQNLRRRHRSQSRHRPNAHHPNPNPQIFRPRHSTSAITEHGPVVTVGVIRLNGFVEPSDLFFPTRPFMPLWGRHCHEI